MKKCKNCGERIPDETVRCPHCGAQQLPEEKEECSIRYCSRCGKEIDKNDKYCPRCGKEINRKEKKDLFIQIPKGTLKVFGIIFGIVYIYNTVKYIPYLGYYLISYKIWGAGMIAACAWNALILFVIAFKCQEKNGRHLIYALIGGTFLNCLLQTIQNIKLWGYYGSRISDCYLIMGAVLIALACYYLMKHDGLILPLKDKESVIQTIREIPGILSELLFKESKLCAKKETSIQEMPEDLNPVQVKIWKLIVSKQFFLFLLIYTINLIYQLSSDFAFFKIVKNFFPILFSIGMWMIYWEGKKRTLHKGGFSMISALTTIKFILHITIAALIFLLAIKLELEIQAEPEVQAVTITALLIVILLDLFYYGVLYKMALCIKQISNGLKNTIDLFVYPLCILSLNVVFRSLIFAVISYERYAVSSTIDSMGQYGEDVVNFLLSVLYTFGVEFELEGFIDMLGNLYYMIDDFVYDIPPSVANLLFARIEGWLQTTFGFGQTGFAMMLLLAVPIFEMIVLSKLNSYAEEK